MTTAIHTAEIRPNHHELIIVASPDKSGMLQTARRWKREHPGKRIRYRTILVADDREAQEEKAA